VLVVGVLVLPGCALLGGGDGSRDEGQRERPDGSSGPAVSDLSEVRSAVVRIVAEGTFVDPEQGELLNTAGSGSGFIVHPDGIVVTNNHVVTGAAFLNVYLEGADEPRNAQVLGVSECSDLAVVDLEGEGYPYLSWVPGTPRVGSEVYASGYPLGEEEYTLTKGILSRAATVGETSWASVDAVLLHDARINPGNSGGPLVDPQGRVVGVNYAGDNGSGQFFAIAGDEAKSLVLDLASGQDVTAIGVNGEAFALEDETSGVWVSSVDSGSPAFATGIRGGDIITRLENFAVGDDATMSDYCDVLRSNAPEDVLAVQVFRSSSAELLEGQINGEPLEVTQTFENELRAQVPEAEAGETYSDFRTVQDDTGTISVSVPTSWDFIDGSGLPQEDGTRWPALLATPDPSAFDGSWTVPGAVIAAVPELGVADPAVVLDALGPELTGGACTLVGREPYDDGVYVGQFDLYEACGGTETIFVSVAVAPEDKSYLVYIAMQATDKADLEALDRFLDTFVVTL
jgi:serine protease Do